MHKHTWIPVVAGLVATMMTGCGSPGGGTPSGTAAANPFAGPVGGTLRTSGFNPGDEVGQSRADYAASQLGGVTVSMDKTNFDAQKFAAQAAAGQAPDLVQLDRSVVATFAHKRLILPLDQCYATHKVTPDQQYYPSTIKDVTYNSSVYAVPQFFQATGAAGQQARAGQGRRDGRSDRHVQAGNDRRPGQEAVLRQWWQPVGARFDPYAPGSASIWFTAFGGRLYGDDGAPMLDDPKNVEALDWMKQVLDAQGGYAKVKSFKDSMDVFGKNNQYVADQVGVQTWAQWYPNVLANTASKVSLAAVPIKTTSGKTFGHGRWNVLCHPQVREEPRGRLRLGDCGHVDGRVAGGRQGEGGDRREEPFHRDRPDDWFPYCGQGGA